MPIDTIQKENIPATYMRYSRTILFASSLLLGAAILSGCATRSVYLQDMRFDGPMGYPPLFITNEEHKEGDVRIVPRVTVSGSQTVDGRADGHSGVNARGMFQVDTVTSNGTTRYYERPGVNKEKFEGNNFHWKPASVAASLDIEYMFNNSMSITGGASYASSSLHSYLGASIGFGLAFRSKSLGGRFDAGVQWNSIYYDIDYVVTTTPFSFGTSDTEVRFFNRSGKSFQPNYFLAFTLNTVIPSSPVQAYLQLAITRQTLATFDAPVAFFESSRVHQSGSFFIVTPGLTLDVSSGTRLVAGIRLSDETELLVGEPGVLLAPFVQVELGF